MARTVSCRSLHSNLWCVDLYPLCCLITINVSIIHILIQNRGRKGERSAFIKIIKAFPEPLPQHTSTQGLAGQTWVLCPARETANLKGWVLGGRGLRSAHHPILYNPQTENEFYIFKGLGQGGGGRKSKEYVTRGKITWRFPLGSQSLNFTILPFTGKFVNPCFRLPLPGHTAVLNKIGILAVGRREERLQSRELSVPTPYARSHMPSLHLGI